MIKTYSRLAKFAELKGYCSFAKDGDYIEVTDWYNGEGFDVSISEEKTISLTWGEWELIKELVKHEAINTEEYDLGFRIGYETCLNNIKNKKQSIYSDKWHGDLVSDGGMDPRNRTLELFVCPKCGGFADNGHDREYPPNAYLCTKCQ